MKFINYLRVSNLLCLHSSMKTQQDTVNRRFPNNKVLFVSSKLHFTRISNLLPSLSSTGVKAGRGEEEVFDNFRFRLTNIEKQTEL